MLELSGALGKTHDLPTEKCRIRMKVRLDNPSSSAPAVAIWLYSQFQALSGRNSRPPKCPQEKGNSPKSQWDMENFPKCTWDMGHLPSFHGRWEIPQVYKGYGIFPQVSWDIPPSFLVHARWDIPNRVEKGVVSCGGS